MPAKGKPKVSGAQRRKIAAAKVSEKTHREIAAETGLSITTVDHHANDPRVSTLTLRLKYKDEARLQQAWDLAVGSIVKDLKSKSPELVIAARRDLMRLLRLGDPPAEGGTAGTTNRAISRWKNCSQLVGERR